MLLGGRVMTLKVKCPINENNGDKLDQLGKRMSLSGTPDPSDSS